MSVATVLPNHANLTFTANGLPLVGGCRMYAPQNHTGCNSRDFATPTLGHSASLSSSSSSSSSGDEHDSGYGSAVECSPIDECLSSLGLEIVRHIDGGNYGTIHLAASVLEESSADQSDPRALLVVKEIALVGSRRRSAYHEAAMMMSVCHRHIVELFDMVEVDERLLLVMQHGAGGDLHDLVMSANSPLAPARSCLPLAECRRMFAQMVLALEHMHRNYIVHLDLKPANVFLDHDNNVLIGDFGLSERFDPSCNAIEARPGTLHYSAPETFIGGVMVNGPELDVWSAGVVLYVMMRGRYPFWGKSDRETMTAISMHEPEWPSKHFPPDAVDLLKRMLRKSPYQRISIAAIKRHPFVRDEIAAQTKAIAASSALERKRQQMLRQMLLVP